MHQNSEKVILAIAVPNDDAWRLCLIATLYGQPLGCVDAFIIYQCLWVFWEDSATSGLKIMISQLSQKLESHEQSPGPRASTDLNAHLPVAVGNINKALI